MVERRLRALIRPRRTFSEFVRRKVEYRPFGVKFVGELDEGRFDIRRLSVPVWNETNSDSSFAVVYGRISPTPKGAEIRIEIALAWGAQLTAFILLASFAFVIFANTGGSPLLRGEHFALLAVIAAVLSFFYFAFRMDADKCEGHLRSALEESPLSGPAAENTSAAEIAATTGPDIRTQITWLDLPVRLILAGTACFSLTYSFSSPWPPSIQIIFLGASAYVCWNCFTTFRKDSAEGMGHRIRPRITWLGMPVRLVLLIIFARLDCLFLAVGTYLLFPMPLLRPPFTIVKLTLALCSILVSIPAIIVGVVLLVMVLGLATMSDRIWVGSWQRIGENFPSDDTVKTYLE